MRKEEFRRWLKNTGIQDRSIDTRIGHAEGVESHYGIDLDEQYEEDELKSVLETLEYTRADERESRPNPSKIPIRADNPYDALQSYKAALTKYYEFRIAEASAGPSLSRWDEYLNAARELIEDGTLDREEGYKDDLAKRVAGVRAALLAESDDWAALLIAAVRHNDNNLIGWRNKAKIVEWIKQDPGTVKEALAEMWSDDREEAPIDRVRSFDGRLPEGVFTKGSSTARLDLASYLMMATPEDRLPPIKLTLFERTYDRLGYPSPDGVNDVAGRYGHALAFLDRLIAEAVERGMSRPSRLFDAQSVVWALQERKGRMDEQAGLPTRSPHGRREGEALNTILYGPPGTGKTYRTVERCVEICDGEAPDDLETRRRRYDQLIDEGRVEFVTFHQSYGYEEFVEGIRPVQQDGRVLYQVEPGLLRKVADAARNGRSDKGRSVTRRSKPSFDTLRHKLDGRAREKPVVRTSQSENEYFLTSGEDGVVLVPVRGGKPRAYSWDRIRKLWELELRNDPALVSPADIKAAFGTGTHGSFLWIILQQLRELADGNDAADDPSDEDLLDFVLVIDEINRANISKVFGELITLLEEDKREGAENEVTVTLPYSGDPFKLPPNLHILGTMNTADRSIALLDTALRRRFDFEEVPPEPGRLEDAKARTGVDLPRVLATMNERLEFLVDRDHLIGHAWLMRAKNRLGLDTIMRRKIIPLIAEYFYDDWQKVRAVLGDTDDFVERVALEPPPGIDADTVEGRYRWSVRREFPEGAYECLLGGSGGDADNG